MSKIRNIALIKIDSHIEFYKQANEISPNERKLNADYFRCVSRNQINNSYENNNESVQMRQIPMDGFKFRRATNLAMTILNALRKSLFSTILSYISRDDTPMMKHLIS